MKEDEFLKFKEDVEKLKREKERAEGRLDQLLETLKTEFKCASLKEAQEKLQRMKRKMRKDEEVFQKDYQQYVRKYKRVLERNKNSGE